MSTCACGFARPNSRSSADLESMPPAQTSQIVRSVPGVRVVRASRLQNATDPGPARLRGTRSVFSLRSTSSFGQTCLALRYFLPVGFEIR